MRVGILGGTFDPVHLGHLTMAEEARLQLSLDSVLFVPTGQPWLKEGQPLTESRHRVEMVRLAVESNPHFELCLDEVQRPGLTYTLDTLDTLIQERGKDSSWYFILGVDAIEQFHRWKDPERLLELCNWVVVERPGHQGFDLPGFIARYPGAAGKMQLLSIPAMGISGTELRRRAAAGTSLRYYAPDGVAEYIEQHHVYAAVGPQGKKSSGAATTGSQGAPGSERNTIKRLLDVALDRGALKYGDFTLTSGKKSSYYFDGRLLSLDPEGAQLIAGALLPMLLDAKVDAVGGPTLGADPIVSAIALSSYLAGARIPGFIVRKEAKAHGTGQRIEGPLRPGSRVAIIDDVCTTGGSLFDAIEAAESAGCTVVKVAAVLDRKEGGSEELRRRGYDFVTLLAANPDGTIGVAGR